MIRSMGCVLLASLMVCGASHAQVGFSDSFQKTVRKVAKRRIKQRILHWITEKDPVIGIVARDLIGQVIDSQDEPQLIRSSVNVVTTLLFLMLVREEVSQLAAAHPEVVKQAREAGWDEGKLVAYSSLYVFYSERLKYRLYVSPYVLEMRETKARVESLRTQDRKWTVAVSAAYVREKRQDVTLDVRVLDLVQLAILRRFEQRGEGDSAKVKSLMDDLVGSYARAAERATGAERRRFAWVDTWADTPSLERMLPVFWDAYTASIQASYEAYVEENGLQTLPFDLQFGHNMLLPFTTLVNAVDPSTASVLDPQYARDLLVRSLKASFDAWLRRSNEGFRFDYGLMLAATYLREEEKVEFTVLDQVRFGRFSDNWAVFLFTGGLVDPLLKTTVNESGSRTYFVGLGGSFDAGPGGRLSVSAGAGISYEDFGGEGVFSGDRFGVTVGYEIPVWDLLE